jgi:hypothetical protein
MIATQSTIEDIKKAIANYAKNEIIAIIINTKCE